MKRRIFLGGLGAASAAAWQRSRPKPDRPNVLWIITEDMGPQLACYGFPQMRTPNLDRLASEGVLFRHAYTTAPVCSATRSAFQTGAYQTAIGAHHHRRRSWGGAPAPQPAPWPATGSADNLDMLRDVSAAPPASFVPDLAAGRELGWIM